jgi:class 3 adenylate cyclase/pimeloyl-ACP methyl ester carboxylesterase
MSGGAFHTTPTDAANGRPGRQYGPVTTRSPVETQYADSDGVSIAYQVVGEGHIDLVFLPMWFSHVEQIWESPRRRRFLDGLASFSRLILFDQRGVGLSDSVAITDVLTLEDRMKDVLAVMEAAGSEHPALFAVGNTAALGCYVAASHPNRVRALVVLNGTVRPRSAPDYPVSQGARIASDSDVIRRTWGTPDWPIFADARLTPSEVDESRRYHRNSMGPGNAATLFRAMNRLDARDVLPAIHVPTLVIHRAENVFYATDHGRYIAENVKGARFVEVPGRDPTWGFDPPEAVIEEAQEFLTGTRPTPEPDRILATVLFTDVVGSTKKVSEIGDRGWRRLLEEHAAVVRREIDQFQGCLVRVAGEESLATFDGPARAIRCARAIQEALRASGLEVRAGLHTGEIERVREDIGGIAVHIAARVAAIAEAGEILVSSTVVDLVSGSDLRFNERGEHELKGVRRPWRIYAVAD